MKTNSATFTIMPIASRRSAKSRRSNSHVAAASSIGMNDAHGVRGRNWVRSKPSALIRAERQRHCNHLLTVLLKEVPQVIVQLRPPHFEPHPFSPCVFMFARRRHLIGQSAAARIPRVTPQPPLQVSGLLARQCAAD